jgi:hypothetical protein
MTTTMVVPYGEMTVVKKVFERINELPFLRSFTTFRMTNCGGR